MPQRRRIILVNRKFQLRFAFFVCSWVFGLSLVYPWIIYDLFGTFEQFLKAKNITDASLAGIQNQIMAPLMVLQVVVLATIFVISIFLAHRIAGPVYKLHKTLKDSVAAGKIIPTVQFRKNDHFVELAQAYNEFVALVKSRTEADNSRVSQAVVQLEGIAQRSQGQDKEALEKVLTELRGARDQLSI